MKQSGFSLVELLVAMTILSFMTVLASSAFALFSQNWDGQIGQFDEKFGHARTMISVQESLSSLVPYVVTTQSNTKGFYFEGNRNGFVAVTQQALSQPELPAVVRFSVTQNSELKFDLYYEEWVMQNQVLNRSGDILPFNTPILLLTNLDDVEFQYFGEKTTSTNDVNAANIKAWFDTYNSLDTAYQPQKILVKWLQGSQDNAFYIHLLQPTPGQRSQMSSASDPSNDTKGDRFGY